MIPKLLLRSKKSVKKTLKQYILEENGRRRRVCWVCKNKYPLTLKYFNRDKYRKYGLLNLCKTCARSRAKTYYKFYDLNKDENLKIKCLVCKYTYPATLRYFNAERHKKYGIRHYCKWCQRDSLIKYKPKQRLASQKHYRKNRDSVLARSKLTYRVRRVRHNNIIKQHKYNRSHGWAQ